MCYIATVGWDKKIHIWSDDKDEEVETTKILPYSNVITHHEDIMSAVYCLKTKLIYTGGHDGTLFAWNFDTGTCKYQLHINDETCTSKNFIRESKSVDQLLILNERNKLVSMTPDQTLRFWSLVDTAAPTFKYHCRHPDDDHLTAIAFTQDNNILVTGDTSG